MSKPERVHGTSVVFCGRGLLIRGASGSGKSDLALRLIDAGGTLIADDQTHVEPKDGHAIASAPETIKGLIEVRGFGLVKMPDAGAVRLDTVIQCEAGEIERMPLPASMLVAGISLPLYYIKPFESSAVAKIRAILQNPHIT
jgi:HPr kinase/phosphorylase